MTVWTKRDFEAYDKGLGMYQTCGIFPNVRTRGYHLSRRTYATFDKPDYDTVRHLSDEEVVSALEAGIEYWGSGKPVIRKQAA